MGGFVGGLGVGCEWVWVGWYAGRAGKSFSSAGAAAYH